MTDLRKAAEMGLEALEANLGKWAAKTPAVEALRQALAEPGWVGLTGQELQDLCDRYHNDDIITVENLLLVAEALLRGKNT